MEKLKQANDVTMPLKLYNTANAGCYLNHHLEHLLQEKHFQVFLSQYLMMSLSGNIVRRIFMCNVNEKTGKCDIPQNTQVSYYIQEGLNKARPEGQMEKNKDWHVKQS